MHLSILLALLTLIFPFYGFGATTNISSIYELLSLKKWSNKHVVLTGEQEAIWRGKKRKDIVLKKANNVVIDGGDSGITIYGHSLRLFDCTNVTLRNLVIRVGSQGFKAGDIKESLYIEGCNNIKVEHCSFSWGTDETVSAVNSQNITISHCIISEPLDTPKDSKGKWLHPEKTNHGYGALLRGSRDVVVEQCLFSRCTDRSPSMSPKGKFSPDVTVKSCIVFDWGEQGTKFNSSHGDGGSMSFQLYGNHYIRNAESGPAIAIDPIDDDAELIITTSGNVDGNGNKVPVTFLKSKDKIRVIEKPVTTPYPSIDEILDEIGPSNKTEIDLRVIAEVRNRKLQGALADETRVPEFKEFKKLL